jgi:hypothetical protein
MREGSLRRFVTNRASAVAIGGRRGGVDAVVHLIGVFLRPPLPGRREVLREARGSRRTADGMAEQANGGVADRARSPHRPLRAVQGSRAESGRAAGAQRPYDQSPPTSHGTRWYRAADASSSFATTSSRDGLSGSDRSALGRSCKVKHRLREARHCSPTGARLRPEPVSRTVQLAVDPLVAELVHEPGELLVGDRRQPMVPGRLRSLAVAPCTLPQPSGDHLPVDVPRAAARVARAPGVLHPRSTPARPVAIRTRNAVHVSARLASNRSRTSPTSARAVLGSSAVAT